MATIRWVNPDEQMYPGEPLESIEFKFHFNSANDQPAARLRIEFGLFPERPDAVAPASSADGGQSNAARETDLRDDLPR